MRIAFVGKGGSGKSTISALFSLYQDGKGKNVGLLDVDVNSHTAEVLGVGSGGIRDLSRDEVSTDIRRYLIGSREGMTEYDFLNSTPPARGAQYFSLDNDNYVTKRYGQPIGNNSKVFTVGSYSSASVGLDCHHSTQYIAENLLSHLKLSEDDLIVIDSVAGNDAFGNSLYLQDLLVFIVKPEREGVQVFNRFYALAKKAGVGDRVYAVGNQVMSDRQRAFLKSEIAEDRLIGLLSTSESVVDARLDGDPLSRELISDEYARVFDTLLDLAKKHAQSEVYYYDEIIKLHKKLAKKGWVVGSYRAGMDDQIDNDYIFGS